MTGLRSPDEIVIGDLHGSPELLDAAYYIVHIFLGSHAFGLSLGLDLLAVLIGPRKEPYVIALEPFEPCHGVRHDGAVGMSDMQIIAGIINRCCDVERLFIHRYYFLFHFFLFISTSIVFFSLISRKL